ncbi:FIST C-terminal domain-containing protein [Desulfobulbus rhabdoformis]|uniref:FIST signal transduction protein n=1 Tax=Desulfobulbus rhabdoformis TaxID=34032 RepID=UPI0019641EA3|nr:FIST N-terminal domain-containing protein [Desulfobulbus rhabdoformis]MBM9615994.1 FIST C-terminal domain-containing protein [Desulfobulbus rhabdoformis]
MRIATGATTDLSPEAVLALYETLLEDLQQDPDFIVLFCSEDYEIKPIITALQHRTPNVALHGGTSCKGVMTQMGVAAGENGGLAMLAISDPDGSYGVGVVPCAPDAKEAAQQAINQALINADCPGEVPSMVWLSAVPGHEEAILDGIAEVLGPDVPVAGGSSADNELDGSWKQFTIEEVYNDAVVVTALFPSTDVMFAFHSGYEPTDAKGLITKAGGYEATVNKGVATATSQRTLIEINGRPAAEVYNQWTDGLISDMLGSGGHILGLTTLRPLGRVAGYIGEVPYFQLSHPDSVTADNALTLFSDMAAGDEIVLMRGTVDSLITRAGRVATSAMETHVADPEDVAGALIVYCAGCMLTVENRLGEVVDSIREALPGIPFLGTFTYGEQGCFLNGGNKHGNLMISVLLFTKE